MSRTALSLERETANDEVAVVVAIHAPSGSLVADDDLLFEVENSKATQELRATGDGVLVHELVIGQSVAFGVPLAQIVSQDEWAGVSRGSSEIARVPDIVPEAVTARLLDEPYVSRAAAALLDSHGLTGRQIGVDFVTTDDVRVYLGRANPSTQTPTPAPRQEPAPPAQAPARQGYAPPRQGYAPARQGYAVSGRKRAEIEILGKGAGNTMLSVLGVSLGRLHIARPPGDFFAGRLTDLVIYEAARLLKKFPRLNASYAAGQIIERDDIHAGLAIDSGGCLVVYGIEHADRISLAGLTDIIIDAVARYTTNALTAAELSRATFTVTDLSAAELDFVLPLLPDGQSLILGITQAAESGFKLFAGFDHRVSEGREVATFLGELRDRVQSFATPAGEEVPPEAHCTYCARTLAELRTQRRERGMLRIVDGEGRAALCCASCWNGW